MNNNLSTFYLDSGNYGHFASIKTDHLFISCERVTGGVLKLNVFVCKDSSINTYKEVKKMNVSNCQQIPLMYMLNNQGLEEASKRIVKLFEDKQMTQRDALRVFGKLVKISKNSMHEESTSKMIQLSFENFKRKNHIRK